MSHLARHGFQNTLRGRVLRKLTHECNLAETTHTRFKTALGIDTACKQWSASAEETHMIGSEIFIFQNG